MDEATWQTCEDPKPRVDYLFHRASPRKLRLWACACGRELLSRFVNPRIGRVLALFEGVADGDRAREEQGRPLSKLQWAAEDEQTAGFSRATAGIAHSQWIEMTEGYEGHFALGLLHLASAQAENTFPLARWEGPTDPPTDPGWRSVYSAAQQKQSALARDIFGNPFRPAVADPSWLSSTVVSLARAIDARRAFDRLPVLAEALEEAGCNDGDMLLHCCSPGPHVRGCWVVDLLLGKV